MKYKEAGKIQDLMQSEIRNMSIECETQGGINLSQGICDVPLPHVLEEGITEAVRLGYNHYTRYDGMAYLREEIVKKARAFNHIECDPQKNITVSCGATGALYCTCYALFHPGEEVIIFEPFYGYHVYTLEALGLRPVYVKLQQGSWDIDYELLERAVTSKTRAILISTPSNPCGKIFSEEDFKGLGRMCEKYDLMLLSDEIYEYITYDGRSHLSPASLPYLKERTITISGYSKTFSITGWRIGYSIADGKAAALIGGVNDLVYVCAPSLAQYAVAKAMKELPDSYYSLLREEYQRKRDLLCRTLLECGFSPFVPQGAYYVLADVSLLPGDTSREKAVYLLMEAGIGTVPGDAFYYDGAGAKLVRFCFAKDMEVMKKACDLLLENKEKWCKR